jgi:hypothetical protein
VLDDIQAQKIASKEHPLAVWQPWFKQKGRGGGGW